MSAIAFISNWGSKMGYTHITFGQAIDTGTKLNTHADACTCLVSAINSHHATIDCALFAVATGIAREGGDDPSQVAAIAVQQAAALYMHIYNLILSEDNMLLLRENLTSMMQKANQTIYKYAFKSANGAGETDVACLSAMMIIRDMAHVVHVGDTRIYLCRGNELTILTRDHMREGVKEHTNEPGLYNALGQPETPEIDIESFSIPPDSRLLFCSGSLWRYVTEEDILRILTGERDPHHASSKLIALATGNGATDQIAAIVVHTPNDIEN